MHSIQKVSLKNVNRGPKIFGESSFKVLNQKGAIHSIVKSALSFDQLQEMVGSNQTKKCKWITYDQLANFDSVEKLMDLGAVVILLQIETPTAPKVGHFIVLLDHGNHYEHFDSYGLSMDEELEITQEHHLTKIFKKSKKKIVDNSKKLQRFREDVQTCGRWVVARLLLRHLELTKFLDLINYFNVDHDELVAALTLLLEFKN